MPTGRRSGRHPASLGSGTTSALAAWQIHPTSSEDGGADQRVDFSCNPPARLRLPPVSRQPHLGERLTPRAALPLSNPARQLDEHLPLTTCAQRGAAGPGLPPAPRSPSLRGGPPCPLAAQPLRSGRGGSGAVPAAPSRGCRSAGGAHGQRGRRGRDAPPGRGCQLSGGGRPPPRTPPPRGGSGRETPSSAS